MTWRVTGYEAQELIGSGGTGEVWLARDVERDCEVVLKRLHAGGDARDRIVRRQEASSLVAVHHRNLLRLHAVLSASDRLVLVVDHASGGDLAGVLARRDSVSLPEAVSVLVPVAQALEVAHRAGVVHGDVSATNILLHSDGTPVLGDLGTARLTGRGLDRTLVNCAYADPQVAAGGVPDACADVFGLAAVCWHMLSGSPLWSARTPQDVVEQSRDWVPDPAELSPPSLPAEMRHLLVDSLTPNRAARCTAADFAQRLVTVCAGRPLDPSGASAPADLAWEPAPALDSPDASPASQDPQTGKEPGRRSRRPTRLRRAAVLSGSLVAAVLLGVGAFHLVSAPRETAPGLVAGPVGDDPAASDPASDEAQGTDWTALVQALVDRRTQAYATTTPDLLAEVYAPDSEDLAAEVAQLASRARAGVGAAISHRVLEAVPRHSPTTSDSGPSLEERVVLRVTETVPTVVTDGVEDRLAPVGDTRELTMVLVQVQGQWRVADVRPVTD